MLGGRLFRLPFGSVRRAADPLRVNIVLLLAVFACSLRLCYLIVTYDEAPAPFSRTRALASTPIMAIIVLRPDSRGAISPDRADGHRQTRGGRASAR
jgi:hypothetical protein